ncbi:MAG: phytoene desaturase family protein [Alphaproteobacteria bacterium]|nr:phytoene desaturase family protein [Alphaproteobacteria bacterium]
MTEYLRRVVVVGAGPGGLASAMLCRNAGLDVTVVERMDRVGGRCGTLEVDGFRFDTGPTFFLHPDILEEIFAVCGYDLWSELSFARLDPMYRIVYGSGGKLDCTADVARMEQEIAGLSLADAKRFESFIAYNRDKFTRFKPALEQPWQGWTDLLKPSSLQLLPHLKPHKSLMGDVGSFFEDPRVQLAFTFQAKYLGMSPYNCPSLFSILAFLEYESGVWHPQGGCGAVSQTMARVAEQMGVEFRLGEAVEEILFDGRRAVGVRTNAETLPADALVVNADFAQAMTKLVPNRLRRRWTDAKLARKKFSCSTFMLYLGLDGLYEQFPHHTIYISGDYDRNIADIDQRKVLSADPSLYVQNASVTDETLAPAGKSTLYVLLPVPHQTENIDWSEEMPRYRQVALDQLKRLGLEDIEHRIEVERCLTPDGWAQDFNVFKGATFNLSHGFDQLLHLRPQNKFEDLDSVYIVGGGTHPGSGLPVIYEGARISTRLLLQDFGLEHQWLVPGQAGSSPPRLMRAAE